MPGTDRKIFTDSRASGNEISPDCPILCVPPIFSHRFNGGVFFPAQTVEALVEAIGAFESQQDAFTPEACRNNALRFSEQRFRDEFSTYLERRKQEFDAERSPGFRD